MNEPDFFTQQIYFAWLLRGDVREGLLQKNPTEEEAKKEFLAWWLLFGHKEYPGLYGVTDEQRSIVNEVVTTVGDQAISRITRFLIRARTDVCENFESDMKEDWGRLLRWYFVFGVPEYDLFHLVPESSMQYLGDAAPGITQDTTLPLTRLMHWLWLSRSDVRTAYPLSDAESRERFLAWFHVFGLRENRLFGYIGLSHAVSLYQRLPIFEEGMDPPITRLMWYYWLADPEIHGRIDLRDSQGRLRLKKMVDELLHSPDGLRPLWDMLDSRSGTGPMARNKPADFPICKGDNATRRQLVGKGIQSFGVNLVGYALGELGIGEDVRLMARALEAVGVDFCILNRQPGPEIRQMDFSVVRHLSGEARYPVTIVCMTAFDTVALWLDRPDIFLNTYVIGFWPWELPQWPEAWGEVYELVDEIWCSSRYTFEAFARKSPIPVLQMPMAVVADIPKAAASRAYFALPEGRFIFLFVFDFMSYPARKNPHACIEAFREAFPRGEEPVNLVLKVANVVENSSNWQRIKEACLVDPRIIVLNRNLDKASVMGLMQVCDAYISLHRAEGFGRTIAEAMLQEKPVIATGYSGNVDFLSEVTGFPVSYQLVEVKKGEYPCGEGQVWAEPDVSRAAEQMREVYSNRCLSRQKGRLAGEYVLKNYSPDFVGNQVKSRLAALGSALSGRISEPERKALGLQSADVN